MFRARHVSIARSARKKSSANFGLKRILGCCDLHRRSIVAFSFGYAGIKVFTFAMEAVSVVSGKARTGKAAQGVGAVGENVTRPIFTLVFV